MADDGTINLKDMKVFELEGIRINEFHPQDDGKGEPTEVHLSMSPKGGPKNAILVLRLKSCAVCNNLIAALQKHRDLVWPGN